MLFNWYIGKAPLSPSDSSPRKQGERKLHNLLSLNFTERKYFPSPCLRGEVPEGGWGAKINKNSLTDLAKGINNLYIDVYIMLISSKIRYLLCLCNQ